MRRGFRSILVRALSQPLIGDFKRKVRPALRKLGIDVVIYDPRSNVLSRRAHLLQHHGVEAVLDIGANEGQYALSLREIGFEGPIVSFEPLPEPFARLRARASGDPKWTCVNMAVSDTSGTAQFLVDGADGQCSSFLEMLPDFEQSLAKPHRHRTRCEVAIVTLDEAIDRYVSSKESILVKLDVQGLEGRILSGASDAYDRTVGFQLELSLSPLYAGEIPLAEMVGRLATRGFRLESIEPGQADPQTGRLLQADCLFFRDPR
jgi:FkbM family methyltransferase